MKNMHNIMCFLAGLIFIIGFTAAVFKLANGEQIPLNYIYPQIWMLVSVSFTYLVSRDKKK